MIISNVVTAASITASVWQATARQLTSSAGWLTDVGVPGGAVAANTHLVIQPTSGKMLHGGVLVAAGAAGSTTIDYYDGTRSPLIATAATGLTAVVPSVVLGQTCYLRIDNNDASNANYYSYEFIQYS